MGTTPLWVPLAVAALGFVSTVVGIVVTQVMANRRERDNRTHDLEREHARWAREDRAMTFEHRRAALVDFYEALRKMGVRVHNHGYGISDDDECDDGDELPFGWQTDAWVKLQHLELYAPPQLAALALNAYNTTYRWGHNARYGQFGPTYHDDEEVADVAKTMLLDAIRSDLKVLAARPVTDESQRRALPE